MKKNIHASATIFPVAILSVLFLFLISFSAGAQSLHICKEKCENGMPAGFANSFTFDNTEAGFLYILYNASEPITSKLLLRVEKMVDDIFSPFDAVQLTADAGKKYVGLEYEFKGEGDYKFEITDGKNILATDFVTIKVNDYASNFSNYDNYDYSNTDYTNYDSDYFSNPQSTMYYIDSRVVVTTKKPTDDPETLDTINGGVSGRKLYVWVNNAGHGIIADKILVKIDYKGKYETEYTTLESKNYSVNNGKDTYIFQYKFKKKGDYAVRVDAIGTDGSEIWINDGYFTLK